MIQVSTLSGALLDYWTARAEGVHAEQLEIRQVPRTDVMICVWTKAPVGFTSSREQRLDYSDDWSMCGPLIEKHGIAPVSFLEDDQNTLHPTGRTPYRAWGAFVRGDGGRYIDTYYDEADGQGATPQEAICRAVVRAAFGDEVEDVPA